jgi:plastocyanin
MTKRTNILLAVGIIVLMGAGCAKAPAPATNNNVNEVKAGYTPYKPASGSFTVTIDADGEFDPVTAYITKGTTVTFKNTSTNVHRIVPSTDSKSKFAELDSKTDLAPGESFTVAFDKVGRWLYQDSKNTAFGGAIDVADNNNGNAP